MTMKHTVTMTTIINSGHCSASDDGDKVYAEIFKHLKKKEMVALSFKGVQDLTTAFLNAAVGRLYNGDFEHNFLSTHLSPIEANNEDLHDLKKVVDRAKEFFKDPKKFAKADEEAFEYDD